MTSADPAAFRGTSAPVSLFCHASCRRGNRVDHLARPGSSEMFRIAAGPLGPVPFRIPSSNFLLQKTWRRPSVIAFRMHPNTIGYHPGSGMAFRPEMKWPAGCCRTPGGPVAKPRILRPEFRRWTFFSSTPPAGSTPARPFAAGLLPPDPDPDSPRPRHRRRPGPGRRRRRRMGRLQRRPRPPLGSRSPVPASGPSPTPLSTSPTPFAWLALPRPAPTAARPSTPKTGAAVNLTVARHLADAAADEAPGGDIECDPGALAGLDGLPPFQPVPGRPVVVGRRSRTHGVGPGRPRRRHPRRPKAPPWTP